MRTDGTTRPQILDVRTALEWRSGRVPGAIHVPITDFSARLASLELDKNRPIVAICLSAHRSIPAVRMLQKNGFGNACQLQGGMRSWWKAKFPVDGDGGRSAASAYENSTVAEGDDENAQ
jgi:rhodanese-related sulfurtransferase